MEDIENESTLMRLTTKESPVFVTGLAASVRFNRKLAQAFAEQDRRVNMMEGQKYSKLGTASKNA